MAELAPVADERLLAGMAGAEDAAVYKLSDDQALVATVDFFTPIVDEPYTYGRIAAINALSDIYAMGGAPFLALNVVAFPYAELAEEVLVALLRGGADSCREEGVLVAGGHTIRSPELTYGLAALGFVHPARVVTNAAARPGDELVLTKALGTGVIATAVKAGDCPPATAAGAEASMLASNGPASRAMVAAGVRCATDVTGFGLLGHGWEVARASGVGVRFYASRVPLLVGARELALNYAPGGLTENQRFVADAMTAAPGVPAATLNLLADPQTSGGLLIAVPRGAGAAFARQLGAPAAVVGEVFAADTPRLDVVN